MANKSIYDFSVETLDGQAVPLSNFRGKVLLIINVATFWGSTIEEVIFYRSADWLQADHIISWHITCAVIFYLRLLILCPFPSVPPTECTDGNVWWPQLHCPRIPQQPVRSSVTWWVHWSFWNVTEITDYQPDIILSQEAVVECN